jgi:hypothetical protein
MGSGGCCGHQGEEIEKCPDSSKPELPLRTSRFLLGTDWPFQRANRQLGSVVVRFRAGLNCRDSLIQQFQLVPSRFEFLRVS